MHGRVLLAFAILLVPRPGSPQIPETFENLQVLPAGVPRAELVQRMRSFSFALGVRCEHCHTEPSPGVANRYASDARPAKLQARAMLRMVTTINGTLLAGLPSHASPSVAVDCVTCHRGLPIPKTLQTALFEVAVGKGPAAAVERYRELRRTDPMSGRYNFGEWEINELARRLRESKRPEAAMAILEMNAEFYPKSAEIDFMLGELHNERGEREQALQRYRAAFAKAPDHAGAKRRLDELESKRPWRFEIEPNHASVRFSVPIAGGLTRVTGVFTQADVRMTWDDTNVGFWAVEATIPAATIDTNNDQRDADLRGEKFFDAATYPAIAFRSRRIESLGDAYVAQGDLAIRGVTRAVTLPFRITGVTWDDGRPLLGVAIRWQINRLDFGIGADWRHTIIPNFLGHDIGIEIDFWTRRGQPAGSSPPAR